MFPAFMIAGTHSGVGKTTVTLGIMSALRKRGFRVQPFKVGPDFIDPTHHTAVCGRTSFNLDTFMMRPEGVSRTFSRAIEDADVAVVEGVMGLYDGIDGGEVASSAEVAKVLGLPVVLVVNVHGMSRSAAAVVEGFRRFDPEVRISGIILNQVGSLRHREMLTRVLDLPIFGTLPLRKEVSLPSRHLGLTMGFEADHDLEALATLLEENADLDRMLQICRIPQPYRDLEVKGQLGVKDLTEDLSIAVARDEAFCFYYQENLDLLSARGARLVEWSPLRDDLPPVDGVYLGGGYPELYASQLEGGVSRGQLKKAADDGLPVYGECGGLMYLCRSLVLKDGTRKMTGILPGDTVMTERLQALGYVEAEVIGDNPVVDRGALVRGHEFHYSYTECDSDARLCYRLRRGKGIRDGLDGLVEHNVLGAYLHSHFQSFPLERFLDSCRRYRKC